MIRKEALPCARSSAVVVSTGVELTGSGVRVAQVQRAAAVASGEELDYLPTILPISLGQFLQRLLHLLVLGFLIGKVKALTDCSSGIHKNLSDH